ncbi:TraU family protein [Escherichia coli]
MGCLEGGDLDIAYLSEIDPTWTDSSLTTILNPEAVIFANPIAQGACAADAMPVPLTSRWISCLVCRFAGQYVSVQRLGE